MKKQQLSQLAIDIEACYSIRNATIQLVLAENLMNINKQIEIMDKAISTSKWPEFQEKLEELKYKHYKRDKDGALVQMVADGTIQNTIANMDSYRKEVADLRKEYQEAIDFYKEIMDAPAEIMFKKFKASLLPKDVDGCIHRIYPYMIENE